ncbi:MAG TPA: fused response regulator/phosphatase [Anaerolineales bacterium]|nr:fused response regulator/phosphatase [Anaerolineales bacterium]
MDRNALQVLVIDDSPIDRLMLTSILQKEGYQMLAAPSGMEGFQLAKECHPDIILLDVLMPEVNGFETCAKLKSNPVTSLIPIIFLSSENDKKSRISGLTIGGVDYITKPFETEEVIARLRIHLRIRQAFEALIEQQMNQLSQLAIAQQSILVQPEEMPEARFAVSYRPLHAAGGDFYDVISLGDGINGFFSADISGHDLGAAFITSALKVLLHQNFTPLYTPLEIMNLLNSVLRPVLKDGSILSACCMKLNRRTERLIVVDAGHPPLLRLAADGTVEIIAAKGDLLGAFDTPYFESVELKALKGDRFFLFSDGLIENYHGLNISRRAGMHYLEESIKAHRNMCLEEVVEEAVRSICLSGETASDDILLLGIEV